MKKLSVVIICKNEAHIIGRTLQSVLPLSDDIVVVDSGSTDGTQQIAADCGARVIAADWQGFGKNKNIGIDAAQHDWILSVDADEIVSSALQQAIAAEKLEDPEVVYNILFRNFIGNKGLRFGEWGSDHHIRIFNKTKVRWTDVPVHERLQLPPGARVKTLRGYIEHITMKDITEYAQKMVDYAQLNAEKYFQQGVKATWLKIYIAPSFSFIKHYFFKLGFLDGWEGYVSARMTAFYTFLKYCRLRELYRRERP
jgi:glycosyltransferase involved in cell wall biosynthesis